MGKIFVTGAAGFIGSNLVDFLLEQGHQVVGYDNLSTGQERFLEQARDNPLFTFVRGDVLDTEKLQIALAGSEMVYHFAANADVRNGLNHPRKDLEQNTIATFNVLEAMRNHGVRKVAFSSTGSIYGEAKVIPTPEDAPFPIQTSLYGASKLAGEGLIQAYCEGFGFEGYIFRFVSILGPRYSHGHVFDFYRQLRDNPQSLKVLGNGTQRKSYLHISDCLRAIDQVVKTNSAGEAKHRAFVVNLGHEECCELKDSISWICEHLKISPRLEFGSEDRGWVGDNPFILLDTKKVNSLGWHPQHSIREGVQDTLQWLVENQWVLARE